MSHHPNTPRHTSSARPALTRRGALGLAAATAGLLVACGTNEATPAGAQSGHVTAEQLGQGQSAASYQSATDRVTLCSWADPLPEPAVQPQVAAYEIDGSLANVSVAESLYLGDEARGVLARQGFIVDGGWGADEFFQLYESNRYSYVPNLVTVDSLMHSYHLYFQHLLKDLERGALTDSLARLTAAIL